MWPHWVWFLVPHGAVAYILGATATASRAAAVRIYAIFDLGAIVTGRFPPRRPWYAAKEGRLGAAAEQQVAVRRMMVEYGEQFWGDAWHPLYSFFGGNPLAAMPSLHFATSVMAAHLLREVGPVAGLVGWTYAGLLGVALVYSGRALRGRPARRAGAHRGRAPAGAARGAGVCAALARGADARGPGEGWSVTDGPPQQPVAERRRWRGSGGDPEDAAIEAAQAQAAEQEREEQEDADEEMPRLALTGRRLLLFALFVASAVAFLYFVLPQLAGLRTRGTALKQGDPAGWSSRSCSSACPSAATSSCSAPSSSAATTASTGGPATRSRWPALAATRLFAAAGAGGVALTAWALRRSGMERRLVAVPDGRLHRPALRRVHARAA